MNDFSRQADLDNSVGTAENTLSILHLLLCHTSLQPVAEHLRVPRANSLNIFLNTRKVTHTIDDHLPVVLRHVVVLRSQDHSQGVFLAFRYTHATTDTTPGLELQVLLIEMRCADGTGLGTFSAGHAFLGVVFTNETAV